IVSDSTSKLTEHGVNKLALTMCTLLSSQGPDAPSFFSVKKCLLGQLRYCTTTSVAVESTGFIGVGGPA
ncbi:hypothetical protein ACLBWP_08595, partial [Microbacterium sp. M1A1_1b]